MRVVLDTNVLVSGIFFSGTPGKIITLWLKKKFEVYASPSIIEEYLEVIERMGKNPELASEWETTLTEICHILPDQKIKSLPICRDQHDQKFLTCAALAKANYIVTGDQDLLCLKKVNHSQIISPGLFISLLV